MILAMSVPSENEAREFADFLTHFRTDCQILITTRALSEGSVWEVQTEGFDLPDVIRLAAAFDAGWRRSKSNPNHKT